MTQAERAAALEDEKKKLLTPYIDAEALKAGKKGFTRMGNLFTKQAKKIAKVHKLEEIYKIHSGDFPYISTPTPLSIAYSSVGHIHPFWRSVKQLPKHLALLEKAGYMELYQAGLAFYEEIAGEVDYMERLAIHVDDEIARFKGTTAQQLMMRASKDQEVSKQKRAAFAHYAASLGSWVPAEVIDGQIWVNGSRLEHPESEMVGVMIGRGDRIHPMEAIIIMNEDGEKIVAVRNYTQWRRSSLIIVDRMSAIPSELVAVYG